LRTQQSSYASGAARQPLARGATTEERAASGQRQLREATDRPFGAEPDEELQRAIVRRGSLDPDGGHARAAIDLHVSRSTCFRRRAATTDRVAALALEQRGVPRPGPTRRAPRRS